MVQSATRLTSLLGAAILVVGGAAAASAQTITMQFPVARDTSIAGSSLACDFTPELWDPDGDSVRSIPDWWLNTPSPTGGAWTEAFSNAGGLPSLHGLKGSEHRLLLDWDTLSITQWLADNTRPSDTLTWRLGVYPIDADLDDTQPGPDGEPVSVGIYVQTLESENDWGEGDQETSFPNLDWSSAANAAQGAATQNFARTYYLVDGSDQRAQPMNVDLERSLPWLDNDFGTLAGDPDRNAYSVTGQRDQFEPGNPLPDFTNTDTFLASEVETAVAGGISATVDLDADVVDALLSDPVNRGLVFGPDGAFDNPLGRVAGGDWQVWSREGSGELVDGVPQKLEAPAAYPGPRAPYLEVTVVPGAGVLLGDVNLDDVVNGLDIDPFVATLLEASYQAEADVNEDGQVNGLDVDPFVATVLGGGGAMQAVPEPSAAALFGSGLASLIVGSMSWIGLRRSRSLRTS